jgi:hypothetical protein
MHQLTDEQLATIISWAKKTPDVQAVFLSDKRARGTPSLTAMWSWRSRSQCRTRYGGSPPSSAAVVPGGESLRAALGLAVQLERARADSAPEGGYVEL